MKKLILLAGFIAVALRGQSPSGTVVNPTAGPPDQPFVNLIFYDGSNNPIYVCKAQQIQPVTTSFSVAASTQTNIVVATGVATVTTVSSHKLYTKTRVAVTGSATTLLNTTGVTITSTGSTTFTFTTTAADGTYTDATVSTQFPQTSAPVWSIQSIPFSGSNPTSITFAQPVAIMSQSSKTPSNVKCDDRANY